jgi:CRP-like cAMP-binding protein
MARDEKLDLLRRISLFAGLGNHEIERLGQLADEVDLPAGKRLMTQGERGSELFVIVDGGVAIERDGQPLGTRGAGEILGEIALVDGGPRTATVTVSEPSRLLVLTRAGFHSLMDEFPTIRQSVLETLAQRVRTLDDANCH